MIFIDFWAFRCASCFRHPTLFAFGTIIIAYTALQKCYKRKKNQQFSCVFKNASKNRPPLLGEQAKVDLFVYHKGAITFDETEKARVEKKKKNANMEKYVSLVP